MTENYLDILAQTIRNNWNQPALTDFYLTEDGKAQDTSRGKTYTYGEMYAEIVCVSDLLINLGLQKGDHIAICGVNSSHWAIAYLAIAKMQGVSVTIMHSLQPDEIASLIDFSDAKALFVDEDIWRELKDQSLPRAEHVIRLDDWSVLRGENIPLPFREEQEVGFPHSAPDSLAMICFTSGTTGGVKGVMLSYRSLTNNIGHVIYKAPVDANRVYLALQPFGHMFALLGEFLAQTCYNKNIYILKNSLALQTIFHAIEISKPYAVSLVPYVLEKLYEVYGVEIINVMQQSCKVIATGGANISISLESTYRDNGIPFNVGYGQTETGLAISGAPTPLSRISSCGKIVEGMTCRIATNGEILVKGENVMLGYYKDPEATAQKIDKDGWLHTGDKGHLDEDGYLYVEGRLEQDIIVLPNGENIRPDNIESLINALPEVSESIVLARDGHLVAIVVSSSLPFREESEVGSLRRKILRSVNPQLPLFSQLYDVEITDQPLARTEKQTLKRYLYK